MHLMVIHVSVSLFSAFQVRNHCYFGSVVDDDVSWCQRGVLVCQVYSNSCGWQCHIMMILPDVSVAHRSVQGCFECTVTGGSVCATACRLPTNASLSVTVSRTDTTL